MLHPLDLGLHLGEDARYLAAVDEDVVRPLDARGAPRRLGERRGHRHPRHERHLRHRRRRQRGPEHDRAVEVHAARRVPGAAEPATAGALRLGDHDGPLGGAVARQLARDTLGGIGLGEPADVAPATGQMRCELGGSEPVGRGRERVALRMARLDPVAETAERRDVLPHRGPRAAEPAGELLAGERRRRGTEPGDDPLARRHGRGASLRLRSAAGAEWVSMPMAT